MRHDLSAKFFRLAFRLYPTAFRSAYQNRMEEAFLASLEREVEWRGPTGIPVAWAKVFWDSLRHGLGFRLRPGRLPDPPGEGGVRPGNETPGWISDSFRDLRFALRTTRKSPTFSIVVVFIAALGISLSTLVFTTVNATIFRPPPHIQEPE